MKWPWISRAQHEAEIASLKRKIGEMLMDGHPHFSTQVRYRIKERRVADCLSKFMQSQTSRHLLIWGGDLREFLGYFKEEAVFVKENP